MEKENMFLLEYPQTQCLQVGQCFTDVFEETLWNVLRGIVPFYILHPKLQRSKALGPLDHNTMSLPIQLA